MIRRAPAGEGTVLSGSALATLAAYGIKVVADYGLFAVGSYEGDLDEVAVSREAGVTVIRTPSFNYVRLAGIEIDTRNPETALSTLPADLRLADYPAGSPGLYIIQFVGPPKEEWLKSLDGLGIARIQYVDTNAYIVRAPAGLDILRARLPWFVRFAMPLEPFAKLPAALRGQKQIDPFSVSVLIDRSGPLDDLLERLSGIDPDLRVDSSRANEALVSLNAMGEQCRLLAFDRRVVWIEENQKGFLADERASQISVGHYSGNQATQPGQYQSFLDSSCWSCFHDMSTEIVDVVDSGLTEGPAHPDLNSAGHESRLAAATAFLGISGTDDSYYHGTFIIGLIAGNPTQTGGTQNPGDGGFYWGMGLAPTVRFLNSRIFNDLGGLPRSLTATDVGTFTANAYNRGARFQNNSWALCASNYSLISREYDLRVRDAVTSPPAQRRPLTIVFAAGNNPDQCAVQNQFLRDPATAKNVFTVGASDFSRPALAGTCITNLGISDVTSFSRRGVLNNGDRVRPDVVAPGESLTSARANRQNTSVDCGGLNTIPPGGSGAYYAGRGTSFGTPLVTGATVLLKRRLGGTPSPALTKAYLVGIAQSMHGGIDRYTGGMLGWEPVIPQGWGRLNLATMLTDATPTIVIDEDTSGAPSRRVTATGQRWSRTVSRADYTKPIMLVLVYSDAASAAGTTGGAVNEVHLSALYPLMGAMSWHEGARGTLYTPWCQLGYEPACFLRDSTNTVKRVFIQPDLGTTSLIVYVDAYSITSKAIPYLDPTASANQDWALYVYNAS